MQGQMKWIFLDLGYTLINEDVSHASRNKQAVEYLNSIGICVTEDEFYERVSSASKSFKSPFVTALYEFSHDDKLFIPYPSELEVPYDDAKLVLSKLSKKYKLAVIANQVKGTNERLKKFGLYNYFDFILVSSDVGCSKPDLRIFKAALKRACCKASEAVMIGDRLDNDIVPAKKLGLHTVWMKQGYGGMQSAKEAGCEPDFEVHSIKELLKIF